MKKKKTPLLVWVCGRGRLLSTDTDAYYALGGNQATASPWESSADMPKPIQVSRLVHRPLPHRSYRMSHVLVTVITVIEGSGFGGTGWHLALRTHVRKPVMPHDRLTLPSRPVGVVACQGLGPLLIMCSSPSGAITITECAREEKVPVAVAGF